MKCKKCAEDLDNEEVLAEVAAHNEELLDIRINCPECGAMHNAFVSFQQDFQIID